MKRIAIISLNDHVPWGGSEVFWSSLAKYLLSEGKYEIGISPRKWSETPIEILDLLSQGAIDYRRKPLKKTSSKWSRIILSRIRKVVEHQRNFHILDEFAPHLAILSLGDHNNGKDWMHRCFVKNIPYIIIPQLVKEAYCPVNPILFEELRNGYINARSVWFTSYDNLQLLQRQFAHEFNSSQLINNPVNKLEPVPDFPENQIAQFAVVSSLNVNHKGQDLLLEVLKQAKWKNRPVHFNLYGDGPHRDLIEKLIEFWDIRNVTLQGKENIAEIWKKNQVMLMPSRMEGLSLAFMEALWCMRPVVITDLGDARRFVEDDRNGYLIEAPSVKFLDSALEKIYARKQDWQSMGQLSRQFLIKEITEDPVISIGRKMDAFL